MRKSKLKEKVNMNRKLSKRVREEKGITLISLIVTIIVLIILAGVTIAMLTGENGILGKATTAKNKTEEAQNDENRVIDSYVNEIDKYELATREIGLQEQIDALNEKIRALESKSAVETTVVDFKSPSNGNGWTKITSFPEGYNYDNSYIVSGYIDLGNEVGKYFLPAADNVTWSIIAKTLPDGIYMYVTSDFYNKNGRIVLQKN